MKLSEIILEYIKVLIWPLILIVSFAIYGNDIIQIVKGREFEAFGIKVGQKIEDFSDNYFVELNSLKHEILINEGNKKLLGKIEAMESNARKALSQVRELALEKSELQIVSTDKEDASTFEREGFIAIVNKDVVSAIDLFTKARDLWPNYHNVSEIRGLLIKHKANLLDSNDNVSWKVVIEEVLQKYSWGIPQELREELAKLIT
jgi:hypothetical protein